MSVPDLKFSIPDLVCEPARLDRVIAADLSSETQALLAEKMDTMPEMRRFPAIKGYRELPRRLETAVEGKAGKEALRAVAFEMWAYAHDRRGLSAATFRNPRLESPEWHQERGALGDFVFGVLAGVGLTGNPAAHVLRTLRSLVRGFVLHEMASSFLEPLNHDETYGLTTEALIRGLSAICRGGELIRPFLERDARVCFARTCSRFRGEAKC